MAYDEIFDYKSLVYVIVGAWLTHQCKDGHLQAEKTAPFVERIIARAYGFRDLLDLHAMPGMADGTTNRDNHLGFHHWDWPYSLYSQSKSGTEFQRWIKPFYQFLLLKRAATARVTRIDLRDIRQTRMADHNSLKEFLTEIASSGYGLPSVYQTALWGMTAENLELAKTRVRELVDSWSAESGKTSSDETEGSAS
jgi:hypothetical protein